MVFTIFSNEIRKKYIRITDGNHHYEINWFLIDKFEIILILNFDIEITLHQAN